MAQVRNRGLSRRSFLRVSGMVGATTFANGFYFPALALKSVKPFSKGRVSGRRKLGSLEVSSVGLGCQDFTGTFYATAPSRVFRSCSEATAPILQVTG
jgi:hypothetical protein